MTREDACGYEVMPGTSVYCPLPKGHAGYHRRSDDPSVKEETIIEEILRAAVQEAVLHEREACAKLCEDFHMRYLSEQIRARGSK